MERAFINCETHGAELDLFQNIYPKELSFHATPVRTATKRSLTNSNSTLAARNCCEYLPSLNYLFAVMMW